MMCSKQRSIEDDYGDDLRYLYKSMQDAEWEAPLDVRRKEVYDAYDAKRPEDPVH